MTRSIRFRDYPPATRTYLEALLSDPCAYCGAPSTHLDHIEPQHRGGSHRWLNLVGVCGSCNSRKGTKSLLGFLGSLQLRPLYLDVTEAMRNWGAL